MQRGGGKTKRIGMQTSIGKMSTEVIAAADEMDNAVKIISDVLLRCLMGLLFKHG